MSLVFCSSWDLLSTWLLSCSPNAPDDQLCRDGEDCAQFGPAWHVSQSFSHADWTHRPPRSRLPFAAEPNLPRFRIWHCGSIAMAAMNISFPALQCALLPVLTEVAKVRRVVGVAAGQFGALVPFPIKREIRWETTLSALAIVVLALLTTRWWRTTRPSRSYTFFFGIRRGRECCAALPCCWCLSYCCSLAYPPGNGNSHSGCSLLPVPSWAWQWPFLLGLSGIIGRWAAWFSFEATSESNSIFPTIPARTLVCR